MPREFYDNGKKEEIVKTAMDTRLANKTWKQAHDAAAAIGYKGSLQGIIKLIRATEKRKGKTGRKPGRPAGSKNVAKPFAGALPAGSPDASVIAGMVDELVKKRINDAIDRAIAALEGARA